MLSEKRKERRKFERRAPKTAGVELEAATLEERSRSRSREDFIVRRVLAEVAYATTRIQFLLCKKSLLSSFQSPTDHVEKAGYTPG
jgi:hypothetical protein